MGFLNGNRPASFSPVRFDPALLRALQFARAEHLVAAKGGNIALTEKGQANHFIWSLPYLPPGNS
ncbi:hypothetical protein, partial [Magnetospirillum sp. SS-4]|uniref:hypothetical protein n=1 Tax=Magnetospirillum sp. SS-4 TaxID=2681465 RepID=UPI001C2CFB00